MAASRELGGTLGVAVIGCVFASLYSGPVSAAGGALPEDVLGAASESVTAAFLAAGQLPGEVGQALRASAEQGFYDGLTAGCLVAAGVALTGALVAALTLPARPDTDPAARPSPSVTDPART